MLFKTWPHEGNKHRAGAYTPVCQKITIVTPFHVLTKMVDMVTLRAHSIHKYFKVNIIRRLNFLFL